MDYIRIYNELISQAQNRILNAYSEKHHIIPKCIGGSDQSNNLVELTPEEHYIAHQLLVKIYPNNVALIKAANMMVVNRPGNKIYGWLRRKFSEAQSKAHSGEGNPAYGTMWISNVSIRQSKKVPANSVIEDGWQRLRIIDFDKFEQREQEKERKEDKRRAQKRKRIKTKHTAFRKTLGYRRAKAKRLYIEFKDSKLSLRKFATLKGMVPMTLSKWFREFIPEYNR